MRTKGLTMIKASGHYLIVLLDYVPGEVKTASGIVIATDKGDQRRCATARVINIGETCWQGHYKPDGEPCTPWCDVDDDVMIAEYAGQSFVPDENLTTQEKKFIERLRLIKDDDVLAVYDNESVSDWIKELTKIEVAA